MTYRTPVILLSDTFLANSSEPWRLPDVQALPDIEPRFATQPTSSEPGSSRSELWNSIPPCSQYLRRFSTRPLLRSSTTRTRAPRSTSASTRWEPMNEAPPVTRTVLPFQSAVIDYPDSYGHVLSHEYIHGLLEQRLRTVVSKSLALYRIDCRLIVNQVRVKLRDD